MPGSLHVKCITHCAFMTTVTPRVLLARPVLTIRPGCDVIVGLAKGDRPMAFDLGRKNGDYIDLELVKVN